MASARRIPAAVFKVVIIVLSVSQQSMLSPYQKRFKTRFDNNKITFDLPKLGNSEHLIRQQVQYNSSCFLSPNSSEFWNSTRFENIRDDRRLSLEYFSDALKDPWSAHVVNETLCHEKSRLLDPNPAHLSDDDWHIRLLYLGIYLHQHLPALNEMRNRRSCQENSSASLGGHQLSHINASSSDYECDKDTKFLVATLTANGAGATFRNAAVPVLLAGLASGRVVTFINNRPYGSHHMQYPWKLASAKECPRGDYQCFFLPITPCVLTAAEIMNATQGEETDVWKMLDNGGGPNFVDRRVVAIQTHSVPIKPSPDSEKRIRKRIHELVKDVAQKYNAPTHVLERILLTPFEEYDRTSNTTYKYGRKLDMATSTLHHAALMYILRPTEQMRDLLDADIRDAVPDNFDPEWSFGLPVRASDKCNDESTCLRFDQYMQLATQQYHMYLNGTGRIANIVLTSEVASILSRRHEYNTSAEFPFRFVVNEHDVAQADGDPERYDSTPYGANKIMVSTLSALKLQLTSKYTVVNCCSSFHRIMLDMLRSGCGAAAEPEFRCLQEMEDPQFHVCCGWDNDERCQKAKKDFREDYQNNTKIYTRL